MPGISKRTAIVSIRLKVETIAKIKQAFNTPRNGNTSVSDYCREVIERYAWRHNPEKRPK